MQHLHRKFVSPPSSGAVANTLRDASLPIGFDTGEEYMNAAATVLRLLFIQVQRSEICLVTTFQDLRDMQTRINEVIMMAQNITANPQVHSKVIFSERADLVLDKLEAREGWQMKSIGENTFNRDCMHNGIDREGRACV